ncbi:hypothetical protein R6Q57_022560 [Mikania cordata]
MRRGENSSNMEHWYPIKNRCSPTQITKVVKTLSIKQNDLITKLGFGKLLSLQVDGIPHKLGHFVVDKFDAVKMEICLKGGVVRINVDTIDWLLGIPKTGADLKTFTPRKKLSPRIQQWRDLYKSEYVSPREIAYRMAADTSDESFYFQLDFLLLFISTMVECHAHGKCKLEILDYFNDHTHISQINWSAYVLDSIRNCKNGWKPFSNTPFKRALTILTTQISDVSQMFEMTSENKKLLHIKLEGLLKNNQHNEEIQALAATFENIFKEKVDIQKAHDSTELGINNNLNSGVGNSRSGKKDTIDERIFDICVELNAHRQQFIDSETDEEEMLEDKIVLEDKNQGLEGRDELLENADQNLKEELKLKPGNALSLH